jgi:hypothetical protein
MAATLCLCKIGHVCFARFEATVKKRPQILIVQHGGGEVTRSKVAESAFWKIPTFSGKNTLGVVLIWVATSKTG